MKRVLLIVVLGLVFAAVFAAAASAHPWQFVTVVGPGRVDSTSDDSPSDPCPGCFDTQIVNCRSTNSPCQGIFAGKSIVTLTATPDAGSLVAWGGGCAGTTGPVCVVNMPVEGTERAPDVTVNFAKHVVGDFDGNGSTDISVFRPSEGGWYAKGQPPFPTIWGASGDLAVPGDYNGDGTADIAVFRPSEGSWYVNRQPPFPQIWGQTGDVPVPGDYNGDGTTDIAVFRSGQWYVKGQPPFPVIWGQAGDIPVPGDYNGDRTTDIAVFRQGQWWIKGQSLVIWGQAGDVPVPGDYNGDGTTDIAVYRPSNGGWYVKGQPPFPQLWGGGCDVPDLVPYAIRSLIPNGQCPAG